MMKITTLSPLLGDLSQYKPGWLPKDLIAGLSVAAVQVPTAIAYAQLAGFSPEVGLYSSILPVIVYAFFGSSRQLVVGPDAATCTMVASLVSPIAAGDPVKYVTASAALSMVAGLLMVVGGFTRMGFIVNFFSRPILVGFLNGIAASIIAGQLIKLFGIQVAHHDFIPSLIELFARVPEANPVTVIVGFSTLVILAIISRLAPKAPSSLVALVLATLGLYLYGASTSGVPLVGAVPSGLPHLSLPHVSYHAGQGILVGALGLVIVSFTSGMLTARSFAARSGQSIDANREMWALGMANMSGGLTGCFAITGADSRTAVNTTSGNKTQLSSVIAAVATACVATFLSKLLGLVPVTALAAVLIYSAIRLVDYKSYKALRRIDIFEFRLSILTTIGVLGLGVLPGVALAITLALVALIFRIYNPHDAVLGVLDGRDGFVETEAFPEARTIPGVILWRFDAPLVFFNADYFKSRILDLISGTDPGPRWLVLSLESISQTDATGVKALEETMKELKQRNIRFLVARPKSYMKRLREETDIGKYMTTNDVFPTITAAVEYVRSQEANLSGAKDQEDHPEG